MPIPQVSDVLKQQAAAPGHQRGASATRSSKLLSEDMPPEELKKVLMGYLMPILCLSYVYLMSKIV